MFLGPWHEIKKKPKILFIWCYLKPINTNIDFWKLDLPNLGVNFDKPTKGTRSGVQQKAARSGAVRMSPEGRRKCGINRIFAAFWSWPRDASLVPPFAINTPGFSEQKREESLG